MLNIKNKKTIYIILVILFLVSIIVYFKSFKMGFMSDDFNLLKDPPINPFSPRRWEPIQGLIFFITNKFSFSPLIPRIFFFFLHLTNIFLVYKIIERITRKTFIGLLAAFIFTLFYRSPQVIYWISAASADLCSTTFYLAAIIFYIYFLEKNKKKFYWLSFASFLMGLLTKESVILLPLALFLIEFTIFSKIKETRFRTIVARYLPFWGMAMVFVLFYMATALISGNPFLSRSNYTIASPWQFFDNYTHFFLGLMPIKFRDDNFHFLFINILVVNIIVWFGAILTFMIKKVPREIPLFLSLILIFLLPYALYGWGYQERYLYLAAFAFSGLIAFFIYRLIITFSKFGRYMVLIIFLLTWGYLSLGLIKIRSAEWAFASLATENAAKWVKTTCPKFNQESKEYLFNFPATVNEQVFIFNNGIHNLIRRNCKKSDAELFEGMEIFEEYQYRGLGAEVKKFLENLPDHYELIPDHYVFVFSDREGVIDFSDKFQNLEDFLQKRELL